MLLHTVNKSPFDKSTLTSCLRLAKAGAAVLLIEDGVYAAVTGTAYEKEIVEAMRKLRLYALGPDLKARGMSPQRVIDGISVVDYRGFVDLAVQHHAVQAWL